MKPTYIIIYNNLDSGFSFSREVYAREAGLSDAELHTLGHPLWRDGYSTLPQGGLHKLIAVAADVNAMPAMIEAVPGAGARRLSARLCEVAEAGNG